MKRHFYSSSFVFFLSLFVLSFFQPLNSFSQTVASDTNHIKTLIDSCKVHGDLQCGNDILKLIQQKLTEVQNEKEKIFYLKVEIKTLRNIGNVYRALSNLSKAMEYYQVGRKKAEEIGDKFELAAALLNIGNVYTDLSDYSKALDYQKKSLIMFREIKVERGIGICLNNLGNIYKNQSNYTKALEYFKNSLTIQQQRADTFEIMTCFNNIGTVYEKLSNFSKAREYYETGLKYAKGINDADGIIRSLSGIGNILYLTGKQKEAEQYSYEVLKLSKEAGNVYIQSEAYKSLRNVFEKQGRYKEALAEFDKHITLRDSIFSQQQSQDIAHRDAKYESDKKEATMTAEQEKEREVAAAESKKQKVIITSVILGLLFSIVFGGFIFRSLRITRKQKILIEVQKKEVENKNHIIAEKNKDITDSITYAKRIQQAKLPKKDDIYSALSNCFVLFKPKDIVSGDFYFFQRKNKLIFIAAADCTGHGVPGAFMSMIGSEKLEDAVSQSSDTSEILSLLNKGIKTSLKQSEEDEKSTRDGMDIAFCSIDLENRIVRYAGANRPFWFIRNGQTTVEEIKATKKAIGGFTEDNQHYDSHKIQMQQGDSFYLSTDGYADTFGKDGKKLMTKKFKDVLLSIQHKSMKEQEKHLDEFVENWKSGTEQVDDILVVGVRL